MFCIFDATEKGIISVISFLIVHCRHIGIELILYIDVVSYNIAKFTYLCWQFCVVPVIFFFFNVDDHVTCAGRFASFSLGVLLFPICTFH